MPLDLQGEGWEASEMGATSTGVLEQEGVQVDGESSKGIPHPQVVFAKLECFQNFQNQPRLHKKPETENFI